VPVRAQAEQPQRDPDTGIEHGRELLLIVCRRLFEGQLRADAYDRLTGGRVWEEPWPAPDPRYLESDTYTLVCQVNGKVRDRVDASASATEEELAALCRGAPNVQAHVDGKEVVKEVVVPGKLVNVVVR